MAWWSLFISHYVRYTERGNLEIHLFNVQTKLRAARQKTWYPPDGKLVSDINKVRNIGRVCDHCVVKYVCIAIDHRIRKYSTNNHLHVQNMYL